MKKSLLVIALTALTSLCSLASCDDPNKGPANTDGVTFHTGYADLSIEAVKPSSNGKIEKPLINQAGFNVLGFYKDKSFSEPVNFDESIGDVKDIYVKALKGEGTSASPYLIESNLSLNSLTHLGEASSAIAELTASFEALSSYTDDYESTIFNGVLDGKGHTITLQEEGNNTGLFYKLGETGKISNLSIVGNIVGIKSSTGAVVNHNYGTIENVTTFGTSKHKTNGFENGVTLITQYDEEDPSIVLNDFGTAGVLSTLEKGGAGGISGTNYETGLIKNCTNKMRVGATIGGGSMAGINYGRIEGCFNQGAIGTSGNSAVNSTTYFTNPEFSFSYIGGMAGANFGEINQCVNSNQVFVARLPWLYNNAPGGYDDFIGRIRVGGIAGYNYGKYDSQTNTFDGGIITECVNYGRVHGDMQVGGIAGYSNGYISDCFFAGLLGGRDSVAGIAGWQPGDKEGDFPGIVKNCVGISRIFEGSESSVYDINENTIVSTKLTNRSSSVSKSNVSDYYRIAKYASNCVYHNYSGNYEPTDYEALKAEEEETNTCISTTATMGKKVYDKVNNSETNLWKYVPEAEATSIVGIHKSWQTFLNVRLAWQEKTITVKMPDGDVVINGIAGIDYINTVLAANAEGKYISDWDANLSGVMAGKGLPNIDFNTETQQLIWVTKQNDASTAWDGLLKDNITVYPMVVDK